MPPDEADVEDSERKTARGRCGFNDACPRRDAYRSELMMLERRKRGRTRGRPAGEERGATTADVREEVAVRIAVAVE